LSKTIKISCLEDTRQNHGLEVRQFFFVENSSFDGYSLPLFCCLGRKKTLFCSGGYEIIVVNSYIFFKFQIQVFFPLFIHSWYPLT
jgi:hypothetical protein